MASSTNQTFYQFKDEKDNIYEDGEMLDKLVRQGIIEKVDGFMVKAKELEANLKYKPEEFIKMAKDEFEKKNDVLAAESLWGAAASAVKLFYLKLDVDLKSHNSRNMFVLVAARHYLPRLVDEQEFLQKWQAASRCHSFFYEHTVDNGRGRLDFEDNLKKVEEFVETFAKWEENPRPIVGPIQAALAKPDDLGLTVKRFKKGYEKQFAGDKHHVSYEVA